MGFVVNLMLLAAVKRILQIDQELTKLRPWLEWHPFLTHGVEVNVLNNK